MPEAILKFKLPEEQEEFKRASEANNTVADIESFSWALKGLAAGGEQPSWDEVLNLFNEYLGEYIG